MAPVKKPHNAQKARKVRATRKGYTMAMKTFARSLKTHDKLTNSQIKIKLKERYGIDVPPSTLATWWNPRNLAIAANIPEERRNSNDKRHNPAQRPDVLVDMEKILQRKVISVKLKGIPYTREMIQILAIHIFQKLISYNLYNSKGMRKDHSQPLQDEVVHSVQQGRLVTKYLAKS